MSEGESCEIDYEDVVTTIVGFSDLVEGLIKSVATKCVDEGEKTVLIAGLIMNLRQSLKLTEEVLKIMLEKECNSE